MKIPERTRQLGKTAAFFYNMGFYCLFGLIACWVLHLANYWWGFWLEVFCVAGISLGWGFGMAYLGAAKDYYTAWRLFTGPSVPEDSKCCLHPHGHQGSAGDSVDASE